MAKFNLSTDKQLFVRGVITSLKAGEHETTDKDLIAALQGAHGVTEVKAKSSKEKAAE